LSEDFRHVVGRHAMKLQEAYLATLPAAIVSLDKAQRLLMTELMRD
jgi:hypothetical protein